MSTPQPATEPASRSARLDRIIGELLNQTPEIEAAAVVSFDGLPMASALPKDMDEDRVAAMSAALLSLGERAAQGLGRGELSQIYIEGEHGTVFLVAAQDEGVLVAVTAPGAKVGMMLYEVRLAAARVAEALVAPPVPAVRPATEPVHLNGAAPAPAPVPPYSPQTPASYEMSAPDAVPQAASYEQAGYDTASYQPGGYQEPAYLPSASADDTVTPDVPAAHADDAGWSTYAGAAPTSVTPGEQASWS